MSLSVFAPVSIGNFIVGFDLLGAALKDCSGELFGDIVTLTASTQRELRITGEFSHRLPADPRENIVYACIEAFDSALRLQGHTPRQDYRLCLEKRLPVGSGLGSSASSIVAALKALDLWQGCPLGDKALLQLAGAMEGRVSGGVHYDNVAPSLLGGLQLLSEEGECRRLPLPSHWRFVLFHPGICVATREARAVLPEQFPRSAVLQFGQRLAAFVDAAHRGDEPALLNVLRDDIFVPHRAPLVPGFREAEKAARQAGAVAFGLSGSGPTVFAIVTEHKVAPVLLAIEQAFPKNADSFSRVCELDSQGARAL